jgi:hypothetical protein
MRMPSSRAVHFLLQSRTVSRRLLTVVLVRHQLLELQEQAPHESADHEEIDAMSSVDEDKVSSL